MSSKKYSPLKYTWFSLASFPQMEYKVLDMHPLRATPSFVSFQKKSKAFVQSSSISIYINVQIKAIIPCEGPLPEQKLDRLLLPGYTEIYNIQVNFSSWVKASLKPGLNAHTYINIHWLLSNDAIQINYILHCNLVTFQFNFSISKFFYSKCYNVCWSVVSCLEPSKLLVGGSRLVVIISILKQRIIVVIYF